MITPENWIAGLIAVCDSGGNFCGFAVRGLARPAGNLVGGYKGLASRITWDYLVGDSWRRKS